MIIKFESIVHKVGMINNKSTLPGLIHYSVIQMN